MARYSSLFIAGVPAETARQNLVDILRTCGFEVIYETGEYVMAREKPGGVSYTKLVTVEGLIDVTSATHNRVQVKIVAKNEELPLHVNNHCEQLFNNIQDTISLDRSWEPVRNAMN